MSVFPAVLSLQDRVRDLEQQLELAEWYRNRLDGTREQLRVVDLQLAAAVGASQDALHAAMDVAELEGAAAEHPGQPSDHPALSIAVARTLTPGSGHGGSERRCGQGVSRSACCNCDLELGRVLQSVPEVCTRCWQQCVHHGVDLPGATEVGAGRAGHQYVLVKPRIAGARKHAERVWRAARLLFLCCAACRLISDSAMQSMAIQAQRSEGDLQAGPEMMHVGLAVPLALTSPCWLGAAAPVWRGRACAGSKSDESADDMSELSSDFEELYSEGDSSNAELKELQVC